MIISSWLGSEVASMVTSLKLLYTGPVSTGMGDLIWIQLLLEEVLSWYLTSHPDQLSLAIPP